MNLMGEIKCVLLLLNFKNLSRTDDFWYFCGSGRVVNLFQVRNIRDQIF